MSRALTLAMVASTLFLLVPAAIPVAAKSTQLQVFVAASSPVFPGQTVQISALVQFNNGTAEGNKASFTGSRIYYPNGTSVTLPAPTVVAAQMVLWSYRVPSRAPDGLYTVAIRATVAPNATWGQGSFTVNSQLASQSSLAALSSQVALLSSNLKGNFTVVLNTISQDFGATMTSLDNLMANSDAALSALAGLSSDLAGNLTALSDSLAAVNETVSDLKAALAAGLGEVSSALGPLATSAQANALSSAISSLSSEVSDISGQVSGISTTQTYLLLAVVAVAVVLVLLLVFRRRS